MMNETEKRRLFLDHVYIYKDDVYRIIKNVFYDPYIADELTQMVFFNAWKGFHGLRDMSKGKQWVMAITRNVIRAYMQKKAAHPITVEETDLANNYEHNDELHQVEADVLDVIMGKETYEMIGKAIRSLEPEYRDIVRMRLIGDISLKDISRQTGIKYGTVRVTYIRGLKMVKDAYLKLERGGDLND